MPIIAAEFQNKSDPIYLRVLTFQCVNPANLVAEQQNFSTSKSTNSRAAYLIS